VRPWQPPAPVVAGAAAVALAVVSGIGGVVVLAATLGVRFLLRARQRLDEAVTVGAAAGGLILAGAVLSQRPWRSVDGYVGHSWGVQLLALISVCAVAASLVEFRRR
jgi:arabinofuranan 3-O-arabinosyltransferase